MHRRTFLLTGTLLAILASIAGPLRAAAPVPPQQPGVFDPGVLRRMAQELAQKPFQAPDGKLPEPLAHLTYDQYRDFRFDPQRALWRDQGLPFTLQLFHRGFLYTNRVDLYEVVDGVAQPIHYSPDLFTSGANPRPPDNDIGFAGFRIHAPLNRPDYFDEVAAFLGASYFRAVGKGQGYGLSARGLAIRTADPSGEEFPVFKTFWIERPHPGVNSIVVNALLDSPSTAGALRFTIRPGEDTVFDVEATLYPRADIAETGIAPLTSMFYFDANNRAGVDDYRPAVHDSDGLLMWTGRGEQLWRPLDDPHDLPLSTFSDVNPRGFGLMQRKRSFATYDNLEAHYERRPSLWVEPIGDWGEGAVRLIEIPTAQEIHDNVVAFWRPAQPLKAKGEYGYTYRQRSMRPIALNRKNALFAGHDAGAENWACLASLIETCKLNGVDPQAYLTDVLTKLVNLWPAARIDELMPWVWAPLRAAATGRPEGSAFRRNSREIVDLARPSSLEIDPASAQQRAKSQVGLSPPSTSARRIAWQHLLKVLINLADIKSAGGVALRVGIQASPPARDGRSAGPAASRARSGRRADFSSPRR